MSTPSKIGLQRKNNSIDDVIGSIYCHWDGHIESVGRMLVEHYTDREKVEDLIALGSISALGEKLGPDEGEKHDFWKPIKGITIAYCRDRNDDIRIMESTYANYFDDRYSYLFNENDEWVVKYEGVVQKVSELLKKI